MYLVNRFKWCILYIGFACTLRRLVFTKHQTFALMPIGALTPCFCKHVAHINVPSKISHSIKCRRWSVNNFFYLGEERKLKWATTFALGKRFSIQFIQYFKTRIGIVRLKTVITLFKRAMKDDEATDCVKDSVKNQIITLYFRTSCHTYVNCGKVVSLSKRTEPKTVST